jgi:hypothetical protein
MKYMYKVTIATGPRDASALSANGSSAQDVNFEAEDELAYEKSANRIHKSV